MIALGRTLFHRIIPISGLRISERGVAMRFYSIKICLIAALGTLSLDASADMYGKATLVTKSGESVSSDKIPMDDSNSSGEWPIRLSNTKSWTRVKYDQLAEITVSKTGGHCKIRDGIIRVNSGRTFHIYDSEPIDYTLFSSGRGDDIPVTLYNPLNGGETVRKIDCDNIRKIIFSDNVAGSFRKSEDGRYYPPDYVYDPFTGKKMKLVDGAGRTSKK
jgi:hypothetical protein